MTNTYTEWTKNNLKLNDFLDIQSYKTTRMDVIHYLEEKAKQIKENEKFDIIILDPPTFSNSKNTDTTLDLNKDWSKLIESCSKLLSPKGTLYFSTNSRKLKMDENLLPPEMSAEEITSSTIPEDYRNSKIHRAWKITSI